MEPYNIFGSGEECHSSESGWTMYIGSPTYDDDGEDIDNGDDEGIIPVNDLKEDHESDDSMASDASSRPKGNNGLSHFLQVAEEEKLEKKEKKIQEKHIEGKREEKKERVTIDGKGKVPVKCNSKVRKNYLVEKMK
ncbi:PREDICTED: uncharacterized protein LOC109342636 [Lupinus angustifolius]|uniref:uncharacterized protein LOC109342636 n=1 Tax=Lupinus angustifolius TaxID=3871 RepID=UPI00092EBAA5|nr:PREDICTED: uncharacterized protein LOC109342636 [Lupinus angustifolius]